jgi:hypothetical protein
VARCNSAGALKLTHFGPRPSNDMTLRIVLILFLVLFLGAVGGSVYLLTADPPAPVKPIEKVLPNDRFPR